MMTTVVRRCGLQLCAVLTTVVNHSSAETGSGWGVIQGAAHPRPVQENALKSDTIAAKMCLAKYVIQCVIRKYAIQVGNAGVCATSEPGYDTYSSDQ